MDAKPAADYRNKSSKRDFRYAESQLRNLHTKIDKLLNKLDEKEQDEAKTPEEECVICVNSKATMQTWPCGHQVVCRKCLVRTIQMAVSRRSLPLRCVVCRARVLRLKRSSEVSGSGGGGGHNAAAGSATESKTGAASRSHSLPIKLRRRHAAGTVAVRSRSMGTGKPGRLRRSAVGGGVNVSGLRRRDYDGAAAGWADPFATDVDDDVDADVDDDDDDDDQDSDDDDEDDADDRHRQSTTIKYSKLDSADRRHDNQSKNGLRRVLNKFKFWRFLRFKNNKP